MKRDRDKAQAFFTDLCERYYEKVLRYLFAVLGDETAARDCTQEVFLTACKKRALLAQHPNPGGFLFQTAKNLARKTRREAFARMLREESDEEQPVADGEALVENVLDRRIDEHAYIETVLSQLDEDKRELYEQYYHGGLGYREIAQSLGVEEPAVRMRFVRLRREIRAICTRVAEEYFGT